LVGRTPACPAGFVVISYDRLGFAKSLYDRPKGGNLLLITNQRDMLHQLVGEVKSGNYTIAQRNDCSARRFQVIWPTPRSSSLVTVLVEQLSRGTRASITMSPRWSRRTTSNQGSGAVVQQQITNVVVPALVAGDDYVPFFANQQQCVQFNIYPPGAVKRVVSIACDPANFVLTPAGEFTGFNGTRAGDNQFIKTTGNIPVLLTYGDHDAAFPPSTAQADYQYWITNCLSCDVTQWYEPNSGHLFMAHESMPQWVQEVVSWLASRGISPRELDATGPGLEKTRFRNDLTRREKCGFGHHG